MCPLDDRDARYRVDLDATFRALSHASRRRILYALTTETPYREDALATVASVADGADRGTLAVELRHRHLPLLDRDGFVDWNPETGWVGRGPRFGAIRPLLELLCAHRDELPDG